MRCTGIWAGLKLTYFGAWIGFVNVKPEWVFCCSIYFDVLFVSFFFLAEG